TPHWRCPPASANAEPPWAPSWWAATTRKACCCTWARSSKAPPTTTAATPPTTHDQGRVRARPLLPAQPIRSLGVVAARKHLARQHGSLHHPQPAQGRGAPIAPAQI